MATDNHPSSDSVTSANGALVTAMAATPENTPVPGGGSWHWDYASACWAANPPYGESDPAPTPINQPLPE